MSNERTSAIDAPLQGGVTPAVRWLLSATVLTYLVQLTIFGGDTMAAWFGVTPERFPSAVWTVATYMFIHGSLMHLGVNMLMLWMFGPRLEREFGTRSFSWFYVWCGLGGALFHLLLVREGTVIGASGAVVGVVLAYALRWPDEEVYLFGVVPMKARWLAVWTIAWNVAMALSDVSGVTSGTTAWMTHVGGLAFSWLYLHPPSAGGLARIREHIATVPDEQSPVPKAPTRPRRRPQATQQTADDAVARSNAMLSRRRVSERSRDGAQATVKKSKRRADDVNALLDKISTQGLDSLTPAERRLLEEASRRLRNS